MMVSMKKINAPFRSLALAALLLVLPGMLGGCAVNPATGKQSFTAFMSPEREKEVGRQEHAKIIKQFGGVYDDVELGAYVASVGFTLVKVSELPDLGFTFTVLNDDKVNAFALPGGYVYITRGLLAICADESEMAGVLAHEVGHVTARHTAQRYSAAMATNIGLQVLGVLGSAAGIPGGAGNLASLGAQMALQSYSREQELESDSLGIRYLARAGYDPDAMTGFFHKLQAHTRLQGLMAGKDDSSEKFNIMATHPLTSERISESERLAGTAQINGRKRQANIFAAQIDGLLFGDDPEQGIRKGRAFEHPGLGIHFEVPSGFSMVNSPTNVSAYGPDDALIRFNMANEDEYNKAGNPAAYVAAIGIDGNRFKNVENLNVNGMTSATGSISVQADGKTMNAQLVVIFEKTDKIYQLLFLSNPQQTNALSEDFRRTTYSFRRLSKEEIDSIKPLRVRMHSVRPGDTPESLAAAMPMEKFGLEWFDLLNDRAGGGPLEPGVQVRLIGE